MDKLKQQKKDMRVLVEQKMKDLKFAHTRELQKERMVAKTLSRNMSDQKLTFLKEMDKMRSHYKSLLDEQQRRLQALVSSSERPGAQQVIRAHKEQLQQEAHQRLAEKDVMLRRLHKQVSGMREAHKRVVTQNEALKRSKQKLEQQCVYLSDQIVSTLQGQSQSQQRP